MSCFYLYSFPKRTLFSTYSVSNRNESLDLLTVPGTLTVKCFRGLLKKLCSVYTQTRFLTRLSSQLTDSWRCAERTSGRTPERLLVVSFSFNKINEDNLSHHFRPLFPWSPTFSPLYLCFTLEIFITAPLMLVKLNMGHSLSGNFTNLNPKQKQLEQPECWC